MRLETCKGTFEGGLSECVAWLDEMQPGFASVRVDCHSETIEPARYWGDWGKALVVALDELAQVPVVGKKVAL